VDLEIGEGVERGGRGYALDEGRRREGRSDE